jgi:hypothetical protein
MKDQLVILIGQLSAKELEMFFKANRGRIFRVRGIHV